MSIRIGLGFDAHRFADDRPLVLGTIVVEHDSGLAGHSDGDVLSHAILDAILGAAGLGDIGTHFPSSDPRWHGSDSLFFLREVMGLVRASGLRVSNIDATVVCEAPRIEASREKMQAALAAALEVSQEHVGVKATTTDGMGFTGRGEGIAAIAVALLESSRDA